MPIIEKVYEKALDVLRACAKPTGFFASGLKGGYEATWARDSQITSLGASLVSDEFRATIKSSLGLLAKNQTELGLIPNCVGSYNTERQSDVTFNSIDAPLWYVIGHHVYTEAFRDKGLIEKHKKSLDNAAAWLRYQDPNEDGLIVQQPTMDWMDAFPHKYGRVINTQALHYAMLKLRGETQRAERIKDIVNGKIQAYLSLFDKSLGYYLPWVWKDHDGDREQEEWFDTYGNLFAVVSGLATPEIAERILNFIEREKINRPFPCKCLWPPLKPGGKEWHPYFSRCDARTPLSYSNAGIWPFIGGFYVAALIKVKKFAKAEEELALLAAGLMQKTKIRNLSGEFEFNEWLSGETGRPGGEPYQAWSAGMYLYAYECIKRKQVIYF